ncbi:hypothetical protein DYB37_011527 [Aphanomyces astaci]|uniref:Uncharacterized protein n=1 Tax=Aphanomyces astaci TaxID=112090 RepID=A0A418EC55_APHAT|nr:hypothetical protein DYB37_011527 [Aphanomyces astaci]
MHFKGGATKSPRHKRKKRDGRRADGLGLVPQWDANCSTVLFPSLKRPTHIPMEHIASKPHKRHPVRPPPAQSDAMTFSNQASTPRTEFTSLFQSADEEGTPGPGTTTDNTKYCFTSMLPTQAHPYTPRARGAHVPMHDRWTPSIVVPMNSVIDAFSNVVATNKLQADTSKRTVLHIFLDDWLQQFEKEEFNYRSITRKRCSERNLFLEKELKRAQLTLEATMRDWDAELTRTCFFAWYEESIVRKKFSLDEYCLDQFVSYVLQKPSTINDLSLDTFIEFLDALGTFLGQNHVLFSTHAKPVPATSSSQSPFTAHWRRLLVGRCFQEYGSLLFSPSDMCPYVYNAHISDRLHTHKKKRLKKSKASRRNLLAAAQLNDNNNDEDDDDGDNESEITPLTSSRHFVRAFHLWRDMCAALCHASVLDSTSDSSSASFHVKHTKQALAHGRQAMWNSACGMAREKECANNTSIDLLTSRGTYLPPSTSLESHMLVTLLCVDVRPSLFQVLNFESAAIANIFRDEGDAETELVNVRRTFQVNDSCFRLLYTRAGPDTKYALTVDELWRAMKRLRVVTQLVPTPRDDDSAEATQVISVVEFAELLLRICNEQFGELGRLGQRVDRFVVEHLCFLQQAKSTLREEAQNPAMKVVDYMQNLIDFHLYRH